MDATATTPGTTTADPAGAGAVEIRLEGVSKVYPDGSVGVQELDLTFAAGELSVLVGPSGCGKTTTMKMINRIIEPSSGRIVIGGDDVTKLRAQKLRRRIGYVIQNVGLFPHQTIRTNVGTVPRLLGWDKQRTAARVEELLTLVGLDPTAHGDRYPHQLSGGQRQRAGVARALAADPPVLLMDEPFSAVDPVVRGRLQDEFLRLQDTVRKTIVFVTHDIEEAVRLGDRIAVMSEGGHVEQFATPADLLGDPANDFVADFVGADRGLKRLAVTDITLEDLEKPPTLALDDGLGTARAVIARSGANWAVVVDAPGVTGGASNGRHQGTGLPLGWVSAEHAADAAAGGARVVGDVWRPMDAWVPLGSSLRAAYAKLLQVDAGWVGVMDGDKLVGVLTPASVHAALRRSVAGTAPETAGEP